MNTHLSLRAFLAGIFIPTLALPLMLIGFIVLRIVLAVPVPIERGLVFPMALVPCIWGLWNLLWVHSRERTHLPLGLHGALLPLLLLPGGAWTATSLGVLTLGTSSATWFNACTIPYALIVPCFLGALVGYYLLWKIVVVFLNRVVGIA